MYGQYQQKGLSQITSSDEGSVGEVAYYRPGLSNSVLLGEDETGVALAWLGSPPWPLFRVGCYILSRLYFSLTRFILIFCILNQFLGLFHGIDL